MKAADLLSLTSDQLHDAVIEGTMFDRAIEVRCTKKEHAALSQKLAACGRGKVSKYDDDMPAFITDLVSEPQCPRCGEYGTHEECSMGK